VFSCLQNPKWNEWTRIKTNYTNIGSIVDGREIFLGRLTDEEKKGIVNDAADHWSIEGDAKQDFISKIRNSILYYIPRTLIKNIHLALRELELTKPSDEEKRLIYEKNARKSMEGILKDLGFTHIDPKPHKYGGHGVDIFAQAEVKDAYEWRPKAFGEVTTTARVSMKEKIKKWIHWKRDWVREGLFKADKDMIFIMNPPDRLTSGCDEIMDDNDIKFYPYDDNMSQPKQKRKITQRKKIVKTRFVDTKKSGKSIDVCKTVEELVVYLSKEGVSPSSIQKEIIKQFPSETRNLNGLVYRLRLKHNLIVKRKSR